MLLPSMSRSPFSSSSFSTFNHISLLPHTNNFICSHFPQYQFLKLNSIAIFSLHFRSFHPPCSSLSSPSSGESNELHKEDKELIEGIAEIITEAGGVSDVDSLLIASNSPQYANMLNESVRELDELSLWNSWMKDGGMDIAMVPLNLKEKAKYIAKQKGDNGKIPYLESIGLSLASSIHLAGLLSSEPLSSLIIKVKYVKEIFFSSSDDERLVGKRARRMMLHLSISIDEDVQQTLSFFEKIEARRGGLDMLGSCAASFRYLIESFPRLLMLSVESNMKPMVKFLENVGVPREHMGHVLLLYPPLIFRDIEEEIRAGSWAFEMVGAVDIKFGRILVKYPWILSKSILKNYRDILGFFEAEKDDSILKKMSILQCATLCYTMLEQNREEERERSKVPKVSVQRAIRDWPLLMGCAAGKLKPMLEQLDVQGVKTAKLGKLIATSPQLLLQRPQEFQKVVTFLQDLGLDKESIAQILARCPELFATRTIELLQRKLDFLTRLGMLQQEIPRVIKKYPEFLVSDVDRTVAPRLKYLMKSGLTERNIVSMIVRFAPLLGYSIEEVLRPKLEFLVNSMGKSVKEVFYYPRYFSYSMEKKIKPRFFLLKSRNINCSLKDMLAKNDDEFNTEYLSLEQKFVSDR